MFITIMKKFSLSFLLLAFVLPSLKAQDPGFKVPEQSSRSSRQAAAAATAALSARSAVADVAAAAACGALRFCRIFHREEAARAASALSLPLAWLADAKAVCAEASSAHRMAGSVVHPWRRAPLYTLEELRAKFFVMERRVLELEVEAAAARHACAPLIAAASDAADAAARADGYEASDLVYLEGVVADGKAVTVAALWAAAAAAVRAAAAAGDTAAAGESAAFRALRTSAAPTAGGLRLAHAAHAARCAATAAELKARRLVLAAQDALHEDASEAGAQDASPPLASDAARYTASRVAAFAAAHAAHSAAATAAAAFV